MEERLNSAGGNSVPEWRQAAGAAGKQQRPKEQAESEKHSAPDRRAGEALSTRPGQGSDSQRQTRQQQHQTKPDEARQQIKTASIRQEQHQTRSDEARQDSQHRIAPDQTRRAAATDQTKRAAQTRPNQKQSKRRQTETKPEEPRGAELEYQATRKLNSALGWLFKTYFNPMAPSKCHTPIRKNVKHRCT
ncbi:hypothetical protein NPIL_259511 [Nephila pilipes]|uniref:Uncharacterized protein n=1 Tax=Nephila pilipes TaxID=299642 RepID=A0A8X6R460_NEPPI|nr:hypothetical protein NPIL_259511 [Nephila pilipes]